jgi:hypothetical protein
MSLETTIELCMSDRNGEEGEEEGESEKKKDGEELIEVEGKKIKDGNVPESVKEMAEEAAKENELTRDMPSEAYSIDEEEAEKLKKKVKNKIPLLGSETRSGPPPQYMLFLLNNASFLLAAVIPGGALVFAVLLFANLKILPKAASKDMDINSSDNSDKSEDNKKDTPTSLGSREKNRPTSLGTAEDNRPTGLGTAGDNRPADLGIGGGANAATLGTADGSNPGNLGGASNANPLGGVVTRLPSEDASLGGPGNRGAHLKKFEDDAAKALENGGSLTIGSR